jgi:hypothetical protein
VTGEPPDITGAWSHSFEEDTPTTAVYRPSDHPFRPARRVRRGLEFCPDGTFVERRPGPDDRLRERHGHWERHGPNRIAVTLPDGRGTTITVVSRTADKLTIAK